MLRQALTTSIGHVDGQCKKGSLTFIFSRILLPEKFKAVLLFSLSFRFSESSSWLNEENQMTRDKKDCYWLRRENDSSWPKIFRFSVFAENFRFSVLLKIFGFAEMLKVFRLPKNFRFFWAETGRMTPNWRRNRFQPFIFGFTESVLNRICTPGCSWCLSENIKANRKETHLVELGQCWLRLFW